MFGLQKHMRFADPDSDQKLFLHSFYPLGSQILNIKYSKFEVSADNSSVATVTNNLFVTSKNETTNSPIHEFKVLQNVF